MRHIMVFPKPASEALKTSLWPRTTHPHAWVMPEEIWEILQERRRLGFTCWAQVGGLQASVSTPFYVKGTARGALHVARSQQCAFSVRGNELLAGVAGQIGIALENLELISEAYQAAALRKVNQMKSKFIVRASHELRAPV